jgi:hypothetical protein
MNQLLPCPHCSRHHRVCEPVCPFCGGSLPACKPAPPTTARGRLNRATLFAAGAALLGGASCDNRSTIVHYGLPGIVTNPDGSGDTANALDGGDGETRDASDAEDGEAAQQDATDARDGGAQGS